MMAMIIRVLVLANALPPVCSRCVMLFLIQHWHTKIYTYFYHRFTTDSWPHDLTESCSGLGRNAPEHAWIRLPVRTRMRRKGTYNRADTKQPWAETWTSSSASFYTPSICSRSFPQQVKPKNIPILHIFVKCYWVQIATMKLDQLLILPKQ